MKINTVFASFSADDMSKIEAFYRDTLGLKTSDEFGDMGLRVFFESGGEAFIYPKDDHQPADFTVLNFAVENVDDAVAELSKKGVEFERYEGMDHEDSGIVRGNGQGPDIAWFRDPAGNVLAVLTGK